MEELNEYKEMVGEIVHRQNDCWYDTKTLANAVYAILRYLTADRKTENSSKKPNKSKIPTGSEPQTDCKGCKFKSGAFCTVDGDCKYYDRYEPKDEPQTDCNTCKHKGEYAYCRLCGMPGENNYEPQTDVYDYKGNGKWERSE